MALAAKILERAKLALALKVVYALLRANKSLELALLVELIRHYAPRVAKLWGILVEYAAAHILLQEAIRLFMEIMVAEAKPAFARVALHAAILMALIRELRALAPVA